MGTLATQGQPNFLQSLLRNLGDVIPGDPQGNLVAQAESPAGQRLSALAEALLFTVPQLADLPSGGGAAALPPKMSKLLKKSGNVTDASEVFGRKAQEALGESMSPKQSGVDRVSRLTEKMEALDTPDRIVRKLLLPDTFSMLTHPDDIDLRLHQIGKVVDSGALSKIPELRDILRSQISGTRKATMKVLGGPDDLFFEPREVYRERIFSVLDEIEKKVG